MIVIAIIGAIAAIAIPNYYNYRLQAEQVQAQTALSELYTAEQTFFQEFQSYAGSFVGIGFDPRGDYHYTLGFNSDFAGPCGRASWNSGNATYKVGCGPLANKMIKKVTGQTSICDEHNVCSDRDVSFPQISGQGSDSYCPVGGTRLSVTMGQGQGQECSYIGVTGLEVEMGTLMAYTEIDKTNKKVPSFINTAGDMFIAGAIADLKGTMTYDKWLINQGKQLENLASGL